MKWNAGQPVNTRPIAEPSCFCREQFRRFILRHPGGCGFEVKDFLRKIVADAVGDRAMLVLAREFLSVGARVGMGRAIRLPPS